MHRTAQHRPGALASHEASIAMIEHALSTR